ncbi:MAG TPA: cytochrome P450 [Pyrinomonadaceae bacterium]|nr:cytochrome P450 [Pyrinomonadaceae bacterium]
MESVSKLQPTPRVPPRPPGHWFWGNAPEAMGDPLAFYMRVWPEHGDVVQLSAMLVYKWYLVVHPDGVERVLQTNQANYRKAGIFKKSLGLVVGRGLVTSEGDFWRRQRRLAQPAFHRQRLALLAETMARACAETAERWEQTFARTGERFDVAEEMTALTMRIAAETLFGADISADRLRFSRALKVALAHISNRMRNPFVLPESIPSAHNRRFNQARRELDEIVFRIIEGRRRDAADRGDLLSMLMLARDEESGDQMNDRQVKDEVMTLLIAGHETTAAGLAWTWYLLSRNPRARGLLTAELSSTLGGRAPAAEDLPRLSYTRAVFEETMRLYPPAWGQPREAVEDDEIGGFKIKAGRLVLVSQFLTHRHPDFWERPEEFEPERFTPEKAAARPRFAYYPFGGGARQCIGNHFALMEAQLVIAALAQRFSLEVPEGSEPELDATFSLRPRGGVTVTLKRGA